MILSVGHCLLPVTTTITYFFGAISKIVYLSIIRARLLLPNKLTSPVTHVDTFLNTPCF